jgi:hypothetical protein
MRIIPEYISSTCLEVLGGITFVALAGPIAISYYLVSREPTIKTKPLLGKPTLGFLEKQLGNATNARHTRGQIHSIWTDSPLVKLEVKCNYKDIYTKEQKILEQIIPLYESQGEYEKAAEAKQRLKGLIEKLGEN